MFNGKAILIFLCIFLAGGVAGHFTGLRMACEQGKKKPEPTAQAQSQPRRPVEEWSNRFKKEFSTRVGITPEQQASIEPLVVEAQVEFRQLREHFGQQAADVSERLEAHVMTLLTEEQKPKYQQMINERLERFRKKEAERAAAAAAAASRGEPPPGPPHRGDRPPPPPSGEKPATPAEADKVSPPPASGAATPSDKPAPTTEPAKAP